MVVGHSKRFVPAKIHNNFQKLSEMCLKKEIPQSFS